MSANDRILAYVNQPMTQGACLPLREILTRAYQAIKGRLPSEATLKRLFNLVRQAGRWYVFKKRVGRSTLLHICQHDERKIHGIKMARSIVYKKAKENKIHIRQLPRYRNKFPDAIKRKAWQIVGRPAKQNPVEFLKSLIQGKAQARKDTGPTLYGLHFQGCRVKFDRNKAFRYAANALKLGFLTPDIIESYQRALNRHNVKASYERRMDWSSNGTIAHAWNELKTGNYEKHHAFDPAKTKR